MRARGRARADRDSDGFDGSPYACPDCRRDIDPASTTIESGVVYGVCSGCGRTIGFADRSASAELAERWSIDPVDGASSTPLREEVPSAEATVSEDRC
ncbi:hypothetical protein [Halalkalicoccus ordinarius]|uniref:hypothetical protein n=1 Tax=Halalkalicoccus ordinarius TaxID=3116651 RepID=UPI00300E9BF1